MFCTPDPKLKPTMRPGRSLTSAAVMSNGANALTMKARDRMFSPSRLQDASSNVSERLDQVDFICLEPNTGAPPHSRRIDSLNQGPRPAPSGETLPPLPFK